MTKPGPEAGARTPGSAGAEPAHLSAGALRLVSYNIHKGIGGVDRRYRIERVIEVLAALRPDVALLQEVDEGAPRSRLDRQVDVIGDALGLPHRAYHVNVFLSRGHYGNAVLSRFPLDHQSNLDLTQRFRKRRGAEHVRFSVRAGDRPRRVWLYNVHLGLEEAERRRQLQHLLTWHSGHRVHADTAVVVAGDFNDVWRSLGGKVLEPAGFRGIANRPLTFPAFRPLRPLDALFVLGPVEIQRAEAPALKLARVASDHLPLSVALKFR